MCYKLYKLVHDLKCLDVVLQGIKDQGGVYLVKDFHNIYKLDTTLPKAILVKNKRKYKRLHYNQVDKFLIPDLEGPISKVPIVALSLENLEMDPDWNKISQPDVILKYINENRYLL